MTRYAETIADFRPEEGDIITTPVGLVGVPLPYDDGVIG